MATTVTRDRLTLVETAKRTNPNGDLATIVEVLEESNPILEDAPMIEANGRDYHKIVRRLSNPTGTWRQLNKGVSPSVSNTIPITEGMGMLMELNESDKRLVDMSPNPTEYRMQEARSTIEGMSQNVAETMIYGNASVDTTEFDGFATRMATLNADGNVIGGGGTGSDLTSVYLVQWGVNKVTGIYPKGGSGNLGVKHTDNGITMLEDGDGYKYPGYQSLFEIDMGLSVNDSRCIARYANIEASGSNAFDEDILIRLINRMYLGGKGCTLYVSKELKTQMQIKLKDKSNVYYTAGKGNGLSGEEIMFFQGHPVKMVDQILDTETAIT